MRLDTDDLGLTDSEEQGPNKVKLPDRTDEIWDV